MKQHNSELNTGYTAVGRPWSLESTWEISESEGEARKVEYFIKRQKSRNLIKRIIGGEVLTGILGTMVKVPHLRD